MTPDPHEEPARSDSPDGPAPAGEPGVRPAEPLPAPGDAAATAETAPLRAAEPAEPAEVAEPAGVAAAESAQAAETAPRPRWSRRARAGFRAWRRTRPFWGGALVTLGGGEIIFTYKAPMALVMHFGLYGLAGYLVPGLLVVLGLLTLFDPQHRTFYSVLAVLAALGTWLTSNLGGFILGMLLGLIGGSLAFGWQAGPKPVRRRRRRSVPDVAAH